MKEKEEKSNMADTKRTALVGKVVSAKNDKTITVLVETYRNDPLYHKRVKYSKKYAAHDEKNIAKVGDTVRLIGTRPLSKTKRYVLDKVLIESVEI
jgi:small subunit ribosomal protein S17